MRVHVIHAHPVETSYNRALFDTVVDALTAKGHVVDALNLYEEGFDAVLSREERLNYHDVPGNLTPLVKPYVDRLMAAEAMVFVHPVWNYGYPAILKGFFDRVFVPGVSFRMVNGKARPMLHNVGKVAAVTTYGGSRLRAWMMGDPPRKIVNRLTRSIVKPLAPVSYLAHYSMNVSTDATRAAFSAKVKTAMDAF
jgi:NAD(P)H dehydrogenase (quinone)